MRASSPGPRAATTAAVRHLSIVVRFDITRARPSGARGEVPGRPTHVSPRDGHRNADRPHVPATAAPLARRQGRVRGEGRGRPRPGEARQAGALVRVARDGRRASRCAGPCPAPRPEPQDGPRAARAGRAPGPLGDARGRQQAGEGGPSARGQARRIPRPTRPDRARHRGRAARDRGAAAGRQRRGGRRARAHPRPPDRPRARPARALVREERAETRGTGPLHNGAVPQPARTGDVAPPRLRPTSWPLDDPRTDRRPGA